MPDAKNIFYILVIKALLKKGSFIKIVFLGKIDLRIGK